VPRHVGVKQPVSPFSQASRFDELAIGSAALEAKLPIITTISAVAAVVKGIEWLLGKQSEVRSIQEYNSEIATPA